jgi:hypothetical protein
MASIRPTKGLFPAAFSHEGLSKKKKADFLDSSSLLFRLLGCDRLPLDNENILRYYVNIISEYIFVEAA